MNRTILVFCPCKKLVLALLFFFYISSPGLGIAQSTDGSFAAISLSFENNEIISTELPVFVYIEGELSGSIPGNIEIPFVPGPVSIEIGIPQMRVPFYSFVFDPYKSGTEDINIVTSSLYQDSLLAAGFWDQVAVGPTSVEVAKVIAGSTRHFHIVLRSSAYQSLVSLQKKLGAGPTHPDWKGSIPAANYVTDAENFTHFTFNKATSSISELNLSDGGSWSGAFSSIRNTSLDLPLRTETWTIKSAPIGASIWSDVGNMGSTNTDITVQLSSGAFMILRLADYFDCPVMTKCKKIVVGGKVEYSCKLKKM